MPSAHDRRKLRVLIADDHAILRAGLRRLLSEMPDIGSIGEADNGNQVLQLVRSEHWDVLLLDLEMVGQNPLDVLKLLKVDYPALAVLILSMYPEEQFALRALKAGAAGYLHKSSAPEQLMTAIRQVGEGAAYISANLAVALAGHSQAKPIGSVHETLSDREFAVLRGIAAGMSVTEIGKELNLSAKTVSTYRTRLLERLDLRSNIELARYADEHGLVKAPYVRPHK
jgi:DNA-binding NarL/FixJ family response regulator